MILTLDGRRLDTPFAPTDTLRMLLDRVRAGSGANRLITAVRVDGRKLCDDDLSAALAAPVADHAQIDLESGDPNILVRDVLRELATEFGASRDRCEPIAEVLATGDLPAGLRSVGELMNLWQTCYRGIADCSDLLGHDLTQFEYNGQPVTAALAELTEKLQAVRQALEARDMVLLTDIVRYELSPLAEQWQALAANLAEQLDARATAATPAPTPR